MSHPGTKCGVKEKGYRLGPKFKPLPEEERDGLMKRGYVKHHLGPPAYEERLATDDYAWVSWHNGQERVEILQGCEILGSWALAHLKES